SMAEIDEDLPPVDPTEPFDADEADPLESGLEELTSGILAGEAQVIVLAGSGGYGDCLEVSDVLVAECLQNGLSVVCVDAGSGRPTAELGLTDLSVDAAGFGDVVHRVGEDLAEVPWGSMAALERRSMKPAT